jgi:hypothetical protein
VTDLVVAPAKIVSIWEMKLLDLVLGKSQKTVGSLLSDMVGTVRGQWCQVVYVERMTAFHNFLWLVKVKAMTEEMGIGFMGIGFQPKWPVSAIPIMPKV